MRTNIAMIILPLRCLSEFLCYSYFCISIVLIMRARGDRGGCALATPHPSLCALTDFSIIKVSLRIGKASQGGKVRKPLADLPLPCRPAAASLYICSLLAYSCAMQSSINIDTYILI